MMSWADVKGKCPNLSKKEIDSFTLIPYLFNERRLQALLLLFFFVIGVASVDTGPKTVNVTIQIDGGDIFTGVDQTFPSVTINEGQSLLVALETLQRTNSNFQ